jgi:peptide/nickel transport system substrate-binding protein
MTKKILLLALIINFIGCGDNEENSDDLKRTVFRYNQINSITSLDPAFAKSQNNIWAIDHLYNGLVQLDEQLNIRPAIAESWDISEDGKSYQFKLRDDVYFHDNDAFVDSKGRKVTAQDFVYSFNRIISDEVASPGSWIFKGRVVEDQPFIAIDDFTFELRLITPFRPILGILTMQYCSVVPKEAIEKYGKEFRSNPVGTGPFKFKNWLENQALFLAKNKNYFEKEGDKQLPYLDAVRVNFIGDRKTAYLELMNEKLDFMSGLESSFVDELLTTDGNLQPDKEESLQFLKNPFLNTEYLGINLQIGDSNNPLKSRKVRQALNFGFDRNKMLETLRNNVGKAADAGFVPRGLPSFDNQEVKGYTFNPSQARTLLKEAGFPNGEGLPEISLYTNKDYQDLCTFIARQWEDLGVKVNIEVIESATLRQMMTKGQAQMFRGSWIADYPDAESFFTVFYSKNPAPPNYTRFSNQKFDELYEAALKENDNQKRYDLYHQMDRILIEEAPVIFLFYDETALFAEKRIKGLSKNAINLLSLKQVSK